MRLVLLSLLCLTACDAAGPGFRGADKIQREAEGSRFTLRFRGDMVEAIRTSPEMLPKFPAIARRAALVSERERPGCKTAWVEGDPAMMLLGLSCDGRKPPKKPKRREMLFCDLMDLHGRPGGVLEGQMHCAKY